MSTLYGIDGCKDGWLVLRLEARQLSVKVWRILEEFCNVLGKADVVGIDMPIGLPNKTQPIRECDRLARSCLGRRHVCVFSPPCREALGALSRPDASLINKEETDRKVTCQAWGIRGKLVETDRLFLNGNPATDAFHEVHPEVSFAHWRQVQDKLDQPSPFPTTKKRSPGRMQRRNLIDATWPGEVDRMKASLKVSNFVGWAEDDLLDAYACLWTAERIAAGEASRYPDTDTPPTDTRWIPMQIHA